MTTPPTWRDLRRRARRLGVRVEHGRHEAAVIRPGGGMRIASWIDRDADDRVLRTAVAAALEQLEARR